MQTIILILISILAMFGSVFIYSLALESEYRSCNDSTLRIERVTFDDGRESYYLRHKTRLFWIGPYIWEYYQDIYDGNWQSHTAFTWFRCLGDPFYSYEDAKEEYDSLLKYSSKIKKVEIL